MKVEVSRAYSYSRNRRAEKAVSILRERLESRFGEVSISSELNNAVWANGAQSPPKTIEVKVEDGTAYPGEE
ncbi:MAG: hypothetical protein ABEJ03_05295 [Candidatus Nanohaloarchaea archaeon]